MNTEYIVKRCNSFGFIQSMDQMKYIKDYCFPHTIEISKRTKLTLDDIKPSNSTTREATIIVELGYKEVTDVMYPYTSETVVKTIRDEYGAVMKDTQGNDRTYHEIVDIDNIIRKKTDLETYKKEFMEALIVLLNNPDILEENDLLSGEMISYLVDIYPYVRDTKAKRIILKTLFVNHYPAHDLEKEYPIEMLTESKELVFQSELFDDIIVSVDDCEKGKRSSVYRTSDDTLRKSSMGKSNQLDAFSENRFVVIRNKKSACIPATIREQNHHILDYKAINGVLRSPELPNQTSMEVLVKQLEQFDKFDIIFIHPSLESKYTYSEYPNQLNIPKYIMGEGEILSIAYWYIISKFFGYCSVANSEEDSVDYVM